MPKYLRIIYLGFFAHTFFILLECGVGFLVPAENISDF